MRQMVLGIVISGLALAASGTVQAKGCLKGAAVGGVVGHVAGHHAVAGAAAGCVIGHHNAKVKVREAAQAQQAAAQGAPVH